MKLSEFSVKNPLVTNSLTFFIIIIGLISLFNIEREAFPNFSFDIVTVRTNYIGASPDVIEKRITIPIEKEVREVDDLDEVGSISIEGMSLLIIKLNPNASDKNKIISDIERAVEEAEDLPADLDKRPVVKEIKVKDTPVLEVTLSGDLPYSAIRELAKDLEDELLDLNGVSAVARRGFKDREVHVNVNPDKMKDYKISFPQVMAALAQKNINVPGGLLKGEKKELIIRTNGELENKEDVENVIIRANDQGHWVQVKDVAKVEDGFADVQTKTRTDGRESINLQIIKDDSADAIRLKKKITDKIENFIAKNEPKLKYGIVEDISYYIERRLSVLTSNGWIGLILVLVPLVLFLSVRIAISAAIGMPVALLGAFAIMYWTGISINLISMFGLIMVLGMLVDEDIVVAENINRYLEKGYSHEEASIKGAEEVVPAIISVVLTTIIAFVPLLMMTGIFGKFIGDIPKVVIITLFVSAFEALFILPSHISDLHRASGDKKVKMLEKIKQHHTFNRIRDAYIRTLKKCLDKPKLTLGISFGIVVSAFIYATFGLKFILFPAKGIEQFFIRAKAPVGTRLAVTEDLILPLEKMAASLPKNELDHYVTELGIIQNDPGDPFTERGTHLAQVKVYLTPENARKRSADDIMDDFRKHSPQIPGFTKIYFDPVKPGPPVGKPVAVKIKGDDFETMAKIADLFKEALTTVKGVKDITDDYEPGKGELMMEIDEDKAHQAGLTLDTIALNIRHAFEGGKATTIRKTDDEIDVVVRYPESERFNKEALANLEIPNPWGGMTPVNKIATFKEAPGTLSIKHLDFKRVLTVTANVDEDITTSGKVNAYLEDKFQNISKEYPGYIIHYGGEEEDTQESMASLFRALIIAMLLILFVLLFTFGNLKQTLILMLMIPCGMVGIILGFGLHGEPLTFLAMLGMVGLTGVVVDGGTLIFLHINQMRKEGMPLKEAIIEGCLVRFRPIFLTTLTTVLGVFPAAYGIGGNDPFITPMALALNWGLAGSIFFTLLFIPTVYYVVMRGEEKIKEQFKKYFPTKE
ncbi:efflux RND transporter permease subunit [bacterium]|nr:efflux RND transporter permease subunit [bacterium]